ncbi:NADP(H)-dependent aldo-keto reductase [Simiduia curdlanivorans]|uniref:NADP(H)-dependent aldo-keto reductase n=1 Tax=Simiduia curdlanivorans TaxID=1492769 RepID=A0ABV8V802_9GAMM|nr:NADP(H)-dependent aldo-keto reductase [Simiduia curdlanivorans]MDN3640569.1 NADP(H)-dependent aldo-keto reductase [Simiduia curdlanivorans]
MSYKNLGSSDLKVSNICLGTMTFGEQNNQDQAFEQMDYAVAQGINFFDTAELYPVPPKPNTQGATEAIVGNWLAQTGRRDKIILATKVTGRGDANSGVSHIRQGPRLNGDHIRRAIETSLERLKTDYIDLYQVHWPERRANFFGQFGYSHSDDDGVAIEDTLAVLEELVEWGMVRHIGISNETPWGTMEYLRLAREHNMPRIVSIQNPYNLLNRSFEVGLAEVAIREKVDLLAYSPLAFGVLSGKYLRGASPAAARLTLFNRFTRYKNDEVEAATQAYADLAKANNLSLVQMALAYINQQQFVGSNIIGATTLAQLKENIDSTNVTLSDAVNQAIADIHKRYTIPAP